MDWYWLLEGGTGPDIPKPRQNTCSGPWTARRRATLYKGTLAGWGLLFLFPQPGSLPRIPLPSLRAHPARRPRPKEVGPKEGSGILPFLQGFFGQMCIRTLRRKGTAGLRRILGRAGRSGFPGDRGSGGCCERLESKALSGETLLSFPRLPHLWMGVGGLAKVVCVEGGESVHSRESLL